eukprot:207226_1
MASITDFPTESYIWRIPSLSNHVQKLLCHSYIRNQCVSNTKISLDIINLCTQYYYPNDETTINEIKSAPKSTSFSSPIFRMHSLGWILTLFPNGKNTFRYRDRPPFLNTDETQTNAVTLHLKPISFPDNISSISIRVRASLKETNKSHTDIVQLKTSAVYSGDTGEKLPAANWSCAISTNDKLKKLNQMTFKVEITVIDIYDHFGKTVDLSKKKK